MNTDLYSICSKTELHKSKGFREGLYYSLTAIPDKMQISITIIRFSTNVAKT